MTAKKLDKFCLSKKYAVLEYPFGPDPAVYKVGGKIFVMLSKKGGIVKVGLKCDLMVADFLCQQYASVTPMYRSNQWINILCDGSVPDKEILNRIDCSYDIVFKSLPKKTRARLERESHPLFLFPDPRYEPLEVRGGDEYYPNGIFIFNITRLLEHIAGNTSEYMLGEIRVEDYMTRFDTLALEKCADADLSYALILAEISPDRYNVIDGNHRLAKAHHDGVETLQAYMLSPKQHSLFITEQKAYDAYIDYWNGKLHEMQ